MILTVNERDVRSSVDVFFFCERMCINQKGHCEIFRIVSD